MLPELIGRRAENIRVLLERDAFVDARVPLRNGGTLPAAMFAKIALDDLAYLNALLPQTSPDHGTPTWEQLAQDIELLHEVVLARAYANMEQGSSPRVPPAAG